jgi:hypothetical protein
MKRKSPGKSIVKGAKQAVAWAKGKPVAVRETKIYPPRHEMCTRCNQSVPVVQGKGHPYLDNHPMGDFWCSGSGALVEEL